MRKEELFVMDQEGTREVSTLSCSLPVTWDSTGCRGAEMWHAMPPERPACQAPGAASCSGADWAGQGLLSLGMGERAGH